MTTSEDPKATSKDPEATGGHATATSGAPKAELEQPEPSGEQLEPKRRSVMQSLTALCLRYVERLMPDPYLFAVILTLIVAGLVAVLVERRPPSGMLKAWYGGVWGSQNIFTFAFQMMLILVTGYTLAEAAVLKRAIVRVAGTAEQPGAGGAALLHRQCRCVPAELGAGFGGRCPGRPPSRATFSGLAFRLSDRRGVRRLHRLDTGPLVINRAGEHRRCKPHQRDPQDHRIHRAPAPDHLRALQLAVGDDRAGGTRTRGVADGAG